MERNITNHAVASDSVKHAQDEKNCMTFHSNELNQFQEFQNKLSSQLRAQDRLQNKLQLPITAVGASIWS
jgi:hypothetical protein